MMRRVDALEVGDVIIDGNPPETSAITAVVVSTKLIERDRVEIVLEPQGFGSDYRYTWTPDFRWAVEIVS